MKMGSKVKVNETVERYAGQIGTIITMPTRPASKTYVVHMQNGRALALHISQFAAIEEQHDSSRPSHTDS